MTGPGPFLRMRDVPDDVTAQLRKGDVLEFDMTGQRYNVIRDDVVVYSRAKDTTATQCKTRGQ